MAEARRRVAQVVSADEEGERVAEPNRRTRAWGELLKEMHGAGLEVHSFCGRSPTRQAKNDGDRCSAVP